MKTISLLFIIILFVANNSSAQYVPMNIPLTKNGITLENPWAGGLNLPQFSEVDLNNDGIKDLAAYDRFGQLTTTYINNGTPGQVDYHYAPAYAKRIPQRNINFLLFRDYNCDGIEDIFVFEQPPGFGGGIAVYEGSYDANDTIQYVQVKSQLKYDSFFPFLLAIFVYNTDLPSISDIDGDGDLDILSFTLDASFSQNIWWYRNTSVENGYGCDSLDFVLENQCWGQVRETAHKSIVEMSSRTDSCASNIYYNLLFKDPDAAQVRDARHIGASLTAIDINGDSIQDMALGSVLYQNVNLISGIEINDTILITTQDSLFPSYDTPVDIYSFVSTFFLDVDNDGLTDMINSPTETGVGEATRDSVAWYYKNTQSNSNMQFSFQQKDFLVGGMLDVGQQAYPAVIDYNADGLQDLIIGSFGTCHGLNACKEGLVLLENTGTLTSPSFDWVTSDYAGFDSLSISGLHPTFGDLDFDGDQDMILGTQDGTLIYVENIGGMNNPVLWNNPVLNYMTIDVGDESAPFLVDLDRDNDLDIIIGHYGGTLHYYENVGTASVPSFSSTATSTTLGGFNLQATGGRSLKPFVHDNKGFYELYIGQQKGNVVHMNNIDGNVLGVYDTLSLSFANIWEGRFIDFSMADFNTDGEMDYIIGTGRGGITILGVEDTLTTLVRIEPKQKVIKLYPNPAENQLTISFLNHNEGSMYMRIYNSLGQLLMARTNTASSQRYQLDVSTLPSGVLFIDIKTDTYHQVVPFVKK
jgi:hypothetical protein